MSSRVSRADVVVIGGGIVGTSIASELAEAGLAVLVCERSEGPSEASTRNGGGIRAQCRGRTERLLAMRSQRLWCGLASERDFEYTVAGNLRLAYTEQAMSALEHEQAEEAEDGLGTQTWGLDEVRSRAPFLSRKVVGAKFCPSDGHANPILATWAVVQRAKRRGVHYAPATEVTAIGTLAGRVESVALISHGVPGEVTTPLVIHAAGPWTPQLTEPLGLTLPLVPARNSMMVTEPLPQITEWFLSSHEQQVYLRQARKGHVHIGGVFTVPDTFDQTVGVTELEHLSQAVRIVPALAEASVLRSWAGTLDYTPDHKPLLGPVAELPGYVVAAGFSGHGFCLGPAVGEAVAEMILGDAATVDLAELSPDRFVETR